MKLTTKNKNGFTMVETLIGALIIISIVSGISMTLTSSAKLNKKQEVSLIAQKILETSMSALIKNRNFEDIWNPKDEEEDIDPRSIFVEKVPADCSAAKINGTGDVKNLKNLVAYENSRLNSFSTGYKPQSVSIVIEDKNSCAAINAVDSNPEIQTPVENILDSMSYLKQGARVEIKLTPILQGAKFSTTKFKATVSVFVPDALTYNAAKDPIERVFSLTSVIAEGGIFEIKEKRIDL